MSIEKQISEICAITSNACYAGCDETPLVPESSGICDYLDCRSCKQARLLINAGYRKQEWISVEERLPTWQDGKVLVFTTYGFSVCERTVNGRWQGKHANWITHWMPLPEPPKGE